MAQPIPIFTSPSTTLVQVDSNTLQSPYTPVILNTVAFPGQTVTVLNTLSSLAILNEPIVVSTFAGTYFPNSNFSTLIQQPQGFLTAQAVLPNTWTTLNSYPFRDQYLSAGVQSLTTSTFVTALTSTIKDITSSLQVENLVVSGNFFQSSGLILNTSVSSLGSVYILSSLTVLGPTEFSSSVSSISYSVFGSTFQVYGNFFSRSSIQFQNALNVSTSVSAVGDGIVSGPNRPVKLEGGLIGTSLHVQASTPLAMLAAGYFVVEQTLSTLSSMNIGKELFLQDLVVTSNLSSLSSVAFHESVIVGNDLFMKRDLTVQGTLGIGQSLLVGESLTLQDNLTTSKNLVIRDDLLSLSTLSTNYLVAQHAYIQGDLAVSSAVVSTQSLFINGSLGFQSMISLSTTVGGHTSTLSNLVLSKNAFIDGQFITVGSMSTISSFSVLQDVYTLENFFTGTSLYLSGGLTIGGKLDDLHVLNTNLSTVFEKDLSIVNGLSITDTAILSSIVLPSSVLAFSFITSTMTAGYQGIAKNVFISSLQTSSIATGGLLQAEQTMDMANVFQTRNLSTFQLSSLVFQVGLSTQPSTSIQFTSSLGILTTASTNTFDINTTLYTLSNTYINKTLSSAQLFTPLIQGSFVGDGSFLSNINYPAKSSSFSLSTGTLVLERSFISSLIVSSGVVLDAFSVYSTLRVGDFYVYGNAKQDILQASNNMRIKQGTPTFLALNNLYMVGDTNNIVQKQVIVSSNPDPTLASQYTLGVDGTLRLNSLLSPEFSLFIQSFYGDVIVGVNVGSLNTNTVYVSSGSIGYNNVPFFVPSGDSYINLSTNILQPSLSTLGFNSTMFVNQETQKMGINTQAFYDLDVKGEIFSQQGLLISQSTSIQSYLNINQQRSSFWLGVTSNDGTSNILYSADDGESWSTFTPTNGFLGGTLLNVATNGGQLSISRSNTLQSDKLWITTGVPLAQYYREGTDSWFVTRNVSKFPQSNAGIAYNGLLWVLTGYNSSNLSPVTFPPLHWSEDGITWYEALSGGYTWDGVSSSYGGRAVAWNGSLWVTVGEGASATNSILYSGDGKNWSDAVSGGFTNGGYGIAWTGCNWIATGDNGFFSSFIVSADGSNWTDIGGFGFFGTLAQRGNALATNGSLVVAVGTHFTGFPSKSIQYSEDYGYTWQNASGTLFDADGAEGISVVYNGNYWLAGGTTGIRKSFDGKTWTKPSGSLTSGMFHGLAFSSNAQPLLQIGASNYVSSFTSTITSFNVACGIENNTMDSNCLRYSGDGINWSNAISGYFKEQGRAAAHNGSNRWVAAGKGFVSNLIYSADGKNWSDGSFVDVFDGFAIGTGVVYGTDYWVATLDAVGGGGGAGTNVLFYSSNGSVWRAANSGVQFDNGGLGVAFGNGKYTAVGYGNYTILYSQTLSPPDTWTATSITNAFDTKGNGIAYGASLWVACGEDTGGYTIKYSGDQLNWSNGTGIFPTAGYGVAYNGSNLWVAVGNGAGFTPTSNILYSGDAINWSNITSGDFLAYGSGVNYNQGLKLWMAAGFDTPGQTLRYSGDGSNWSNATNSFDFTGYGIGVYSNIVSTQTSYVNQLRFYNTPGYSVTTRDTTPNISYTSTSITYMNTMSIDRFKTVSIQHQAPNYVSSFYDPSLAVISSFVSTQATQVTGYFLTTALV